MKAGVRSAGLVLAAIAAAALAAAPSGTALAQSTRSGGQYPVEIVPSVGGSPIDPIRVTADGKLAAMKSGSSVELWDLEKGRLVRVFKGANNLIAAVALSRDGALVAAAHDEIAKVWRTDTGQELASFEPPVKPTALRFSSDGRSLVLAGHPRIRGGRSLVVREVESGRVTAGLAAESFFSMDVSPDGRTIAVGGIATIRLVSMDGRVLHTMKAHAAQPYSFVWTAAFSPEGKLLATAGFDGVVNIWDSASGRLVRALQGAGDRGTQITVLAWSPDGKTIAAPGEKNESLKFWSVQSGALEHTGIVRTSDGKPSSFTDAHFAPDGKTMVVATAGLSRVDAQTFATVAQYRRNVAYDLVAPAPTDGSEVFLSKASTIEALDLLTGTLREVARLEAGGLNALSASPSGRQIGAIVTKPVGDGNYKRYPAFVDLTAQTAVKVFPVELQNYSFATAVNADGKILAASDDKRIVLLDAQSGNVLRRLEGHTKTIWSLSFSPDGRALAVADADAARLWNLPTAKLSAPLKSPNRGSSSPMKISLDGRYLLERAANFGTAVNQWSLEGPRLMRTLQVPGSTAVVSVIDFHPNRELVLTGGHDSAVHLWNLSSGTLVRSLRGHGSTINHAVFALQGRRIVSSSFDGIKIWNTETGELLLSYLLTEGGEWIAITPEGFFAASDKGSQALSIVSGLEVYSIEQVFQTMYRPDLVREKLAGDPRGLVREAAARLDLTKVLASGGAPNVTVTSPQDGARVDAEQVTVTAQIADRGGGVGRVEWRVNGVTLGVDERGFAAVAAGGGTLQRALFLGQDENLVEVVAYNAQNLIASEPARLRLTWDSAGAKLLPRLHVLAIGINDYWDSRLKLNWAVADAKRMVAALESAGAGFYERVEVASLLDGDVKAERVAAAFEALSRRVRPRDVFVFFLSGHGKTVDGRFYFIPQDFRYQGEQSIVEKGISQEMWQAWFSKIAASKSILLFDSCESGSLTADRLAMRGLEQAAAVERLTRAMGRTVLSAATENTPALEGYEGHGVFTYAVLDALTRGDANNDGFIDMTELAGYVDAIVPDLSHKAFGFRQVPQMKLVGSNFPFARRMETSAVPAPGAVAAPRKPTHVVVQPAPVFATPAAGEALVQLSPGTTVTLVKTEAGWSLVARDGKPIGYVAAKDLVPIQ